MDNLIVVALCDKLHLANSALSILEIVLFDSPDHLLKRVVHDCDHKVAIPLLQSGKGDRDALHVCEAGRSDKQQHLSENELLIFSPWNRHDI